MAPANISFWLFQETCSKAVADKPHITSCFSKENPLEIFFSCIDRYEQSDQGWHESEKREEMTEDAAWYLVVIDDTTDKPIAFSHFRFDMDYGDEVVYWYVTNLSVSVCVFACVFSS